MRIIKLDSTFEFKTDEELRDYFERELPGPTKGKFRLGKGRLAEGTLARGEKLLFCWQRVIRYIALAESDVELNQDGLKKTYGLCVWIACKTIRRANMSLRSLEERLHKETSIQGTLRGRGWNRIQDTRFETRLWKHLRGTDAVADEMLTAIEGTKVEIRLMRRSRSRPLRNKALELSGGTCCVCDVNYGALLNGLGWRVLQVHHKKQMRSADEPRRTRLAHSFLDHDDCGLKSSQKAEHEGLLLLADVTFTTCNGMKESEIEDMFEESIYSAMLQNRYGVSTLSPKFKGNAKWSDRLASAFKHQGKPWSDQIEDKVKAEVAELVEANPAAALNQHKRSSFDALVTALETKLNTIAASKA